MQKIMVYKTAEVIWFCSSMIVVSLSFPCLSFGLPLGVRRRRVALFFPRCLYCLHMPSTHANRIYFDHMWCHWNGKSVKTAREQWVEPPQRGATHSQPVTSRLLMRQPVSKMEGSLFSVIPLAHWAKAPTLLAPKIEKLTRVLIKVCSNCLPFWWF